MLYESSLRFIPQGTIHQMYDMRHMLPTRSSSLKPRSVSQGSLFKLAPSRPKVEKKSGGCFKLRSVTLIVLEIVADVSSGIFWRRSSRPRTPDDGLANLF